MPAAPKFTLLLCLLGGLTAPALQAQDAPPPTEPVRIGVALSGGSAKGFAHVGVLRVLEQAGIRVDVVAGTSMGSVVGAMYASGLSVDSITNIIRAVDWDDALSDGAARPRRFLNQRRFDERALLNLPIESGNVQLAAGATIGSNIIRLAELVTWPVAGVHDFADLPRPFTAVATDIETGLAVPITSGVLSEAMRASIGIPGVFEPFALEGRMLVDGAVARNLPAQDARALGADFVICSDVADPPASQDELGSLVEVLGQVLTLSMQRSNEEQRAFCDIIVRPDLDGLSGRDFDSHDEWFTRGEEAAAQYLDGFQAAARQQSRAPAPIRPAVDLLGDSVQVQFVQIEGSLRPQTQLLVREELGVAEGEYVSPERLAYRLSDLDATGLFGLVRYRLDRVPDGVSLTVQVEERARDRFGVGLRYDDERRAALLFTTTVHNLVRYGSVTRLDLRVGEETRASISYLRRHGVTGRLEGGTTLAWSQGTLRLDQPNRPRAGIELTTLTTQLGFVPGRATFVGIEALGEWSISEDARLPDVLLLGLAAVLDHESLDRLDFPHRGLDATARWELGLTDVTPGSGYTLLTAQARTYFPLHPNWTLDLGAFLGTATGPDLPPHRTFFVGGAHPSAIFPSTQPLFHGIPSEDLTGRATQIARAGLRYTAPRGLELRAGLDIGGTMPAWAFPIPDPLVGFALSIGLNTLVGPALLEWGIASNGYGDRLTVSVGRWF